MVLDVHNKNVCMDLYDKKITSLQAFWWLAQLRYYITDTD